MDREPEWIEESVALAVHDAQLFEHGGGTGVRDSGSLQSALARPRNFLAYADADIPALAARYAYGVARNHPFVDGNKRTAFVLMELFLDLNGWDFRASDAACLTVMTDLAAGILSEDDLAAWIRANGARRG